jgi:hypothetical protein
VTIIDYASPRPRSKLRLPSLSRIVCQVEEDRLIVVEKLEARGVAIGGICFALFMLGYLGVFVIYTSDKMTRPLVGLFWLIEAVLMVLVIHETWRKTVLNVTATDMRLAFTSPVYRKEYRWEVGAVVTVVGTVTANAGTADPLAELRIQIVDGQDVRLFTDHYVVQIDDLTKAVRRVLWGETGDDQRDLVTK